ncbi:MAG: hypothetical protein ACRDZY_13365, partial [Acidimicrobiales bacterium]
EEARKRFKKLAGWNLNEVIENALRKVEEQPNVPTLPEPRTKRDFDAIYHPGGLCTLWDCGRKGVVLAYDEFSPEVAHWFCEYHWDDGTEFPYSSMMTIVEDRRITGDVQEVSQ